MNYMPFLLPPLLFFCYCADAPPSTEKQAVTEQSGLCPDSAWYEIPVDTQQWVCVKQLVLGMKKLEKIPNSVYEMKNLRYLDISMNDIDSLPPDIARLKSVQNLAVNYGPLKYIPPEIAQMTACAVEISA
jgi:hypothetical protein